MTTILVTGGNKGLGREAVRRLVAEGHDVWLGARSRDAGEAAAADTGSRFVQLDVTDEASVRAAVETVRAEGGLDVLVNNAAIFGRDVPIEEITGDDVDEVFRTNVAGVVRVTNAFLPVLRESGAPVIVNVASSLGSIALCTDPERVEYQVDSVTYPPSKSALVAVTMQYAKVLPDFRVNVVDPGHSATEMNGYQGAQTVTEGTDAIVAMATIGVEGPSGTFVNRHGSLPW